MSLVGFFTEIADAIRSKKGTTDKINAVDFPTEIKNLETLDTSDATAIAEDILESKTAYVNGKKLTGSLSDKKGSFLGGPATDISVSNEYQQINSRLKWSWSDSVVSNNTIIQTNVDFDRLVPILGLTSNQIVKGNTVLGVEGSMDALDTSDATATAETMLSGTTAYVKGEKITGDVWDYRNGGSSAGSGIYQLLANSDGSFSVKGKPFNRTLFVGNNTSVTYEVSNKDMVNFLELTPEKIVEGNTIFGIEGSAEVTDWYLTDRDAEYLFYVGSKIHLRDEFLSRCKNITSMSNMFYNIGQGKCNTLDLTILDMSNVTTWGNAFYYAYIITLIMEGCDGGKIRSLSRAFNGCSFLENMIFANNIGKGFTSQQANYSDYTLDLSYSTRLTHDSLMDVINKLYDLNLTYDVNNGGTLYTQQLILGETNIAKLTSEEIAIATNKGWTVS